MGKPVGGAYGRSLWEEPVVETCGRESVGEPVSAHTLGQTRACLSKLTGGCWRLVLHFPSFFLTLAPAVSLLPLLYHR